MTIELLLALAAFAAICSFTPGPNNTLLMSAGMSFGFRRTLPMMCGVIFGFPLMIAALGLGLGQVFAAYPVIYTGLKYVGAAYMLFLAYKIATAIPAADDRVSDAKPPTFPQMVLFQWVNPKGWVMAVSALSAYTVAASYYLGVVAVAGMFLLTGIGSSITWAFFGSSLRRLLNNPRWFRWINVGLAVALVASLWPMLSH